MYKTLTITCCLAAVCLIGCGDDNPVESEGVFTADQFPAELGNWWLYEMVDTIYSTASPLPLVTYDTVFVTVSETITPRPPNIGNATLSYHFRDSTVERHVTINPEWIAFGDEIQILLTRSEWPSSYWKFPLELGQSWHNRVDSYSVNAVGAVKTPAGRFSNAFRIERSFFTIGGTSPHESWLVPGVGIVAYRFNVFNAPSPITDLSHWRLIDWFGASDSNKR